MSQWRPIETAPKDKWVLVYYARGEMADTVSIGCQQDWWFDWDGDVYGTPTNWMPLPEAPQSQDQGGQRVTDRELLERAAKAAGYEVDPVARLFRDDLSCFCCDGDVYFWFNPLTDDVDALRLAVKLGIEVTPFTGSKITRARALGSMGSAEEQHVFDPYAATRRAIVRAAAAMEQS